MMLYSGAIGRNGIGLAYYSMIAAKWIKCVICGDVNSLGRASKVSKKSEGVDEKAKRDEFLVEIGERVKRARSTAELSQRDLGDIAGVSAAYIYLIESGRQNLTMTVFKRIAEALKVPMDVLVASPEALAAPTEQSLGRLTRVIETLIEAFDARRKQDEELQQRIIAARREQDIELLKEMGRIREAYQKLVDVVAQSKGKGQG